MKFGVSCQHIVQDVPGGAFCVITKGTSPLTNGDETMKDINKQIWKSKRFWSAIVGLVMMVLVTYFPDLKNLDPEMILILIGILIGGYTIEETAVQRAQIFNQPKSYPVTSKSESK